MQKKTAFFIVGLIGLWSYMCSAAQHESTVEKEITKYNDDTSHLVFTTDNQNFSLGFKALYQQVVYFARQDNKNDFRADINKARLKVFGRAFSPKITYYIETKLENDSKTAGSGVPGSRYLANFFVNSSNHEYFHTRVGKFPTPFGRNYLVPGAQKRFSHQSLVSKHFSLPDDGNDVGLMLHSGFNQPVEWAIAAISQGLVARVGFNHKGIDGFDVVDFTGGDLRYGIAASFYTPTNYQNKGFEDLRAGLDGIIKYKKAGATTEFFYRNAKETGNKHELGVNAALGYLIDKNWEPGINFSWLKSAGGENTKEIFGGINYYVFGHHLKINGFGGTRFKDKLTTNFFSGLQFQFAI